MSDLIKTEIYQCFMMICCGMATMLVKQIYDIIKATLKLSRIKSIAFEMTFYIIGAYMFTLFLYNCAWGKLEINCLIFFGLGLWLWKKIFYDIINPGERNGQEEKR